eukprot:TRINITY_DN6069_c0_g1_i1.p1 TRINITY_DN6069_c0_g1~~TRINITY_DN6069_c0_g1_i1.p1  ORF type:complete len:372 (-),score=65.73 TRINITY_DN6069_c0_g1_i1:127-1242(-)
MDPEQIKAKQAILVPSIPVPDNATKVRGYDFSSGVDYDALLQTYKTVGFQATAFGLAIEEINKMISWRLSDEPITDDETEELRNPENRKNVRTTIFLGYTSNLMSSGLRETFLYLVKNRMVDCIVTTAGGVEEDIIKCLAPTFIGDFHLSGKKLRENGMNRIGNLLVPNENYAKFEDWIIPIFDTLLKEQKTLGTVWTPSKVIGRLGKEINDESSVYYWAYKNDIPVFCPALTDGSLGDMLYLHSYKSPGLIIDLVQDIRAINRFGLFAVRTGVIILGGGVVKHHICNANLMRNGANSAVYINTAQEFDGSDAGASPDEAVSWGKIRSDATPVKVCADATLVFPLIVSQTFAKIWIPKKKEENNDISDLYG